MCRMAVLMGLTLNHMERENRVSTLYGHRAIASLLKPMRMFLILKGRAMKSLFYIFAYPRYPCTHQINNLNQRTKLKEPHEPKLPCIVPRICKSDWMTAALSYLAQNALQCVRVQCLKVSHKSCYALLFSRIQQTRSSALTDERGTGNTAESF